MQVLKYREKALKEAGKLRVEGKEYVMQDGDVVFFRFNLIFDSLRRRNSPKMAYLRRILTVFVLSRYYVIYCLCFVSLMIFLMLLFVMI